MSPVLHLLRGGIAIVLLLAGLLSSLHAQSFTPAVTKLHGRAPLAQDNYRFGSAVAVSDSYVLVGEPMDGLGGGGPTDGRGAAHLYEATSGRYLRTLRAKDAAVDDMFGCSVALCGNLALVGAYGDDLLKGAAYLFDVRTGAQVRKLTASDGGADNAFGTSVALSGNLAVVGACEDNDLGAYSGSAYFYRGLAGPLGLTSVTKKGDFAPGTVEAAFSAFGAPAVNADGEVALFASMTGKGAGTGGTASGLWTTMPGALSLTARGSSSLGGGVTLTSVSGPVFTQGANLLFQAVRKGTGITTANDAVLLRSEDGAEAAVVLAESGTDAALAGAVWNQFYEVVQPPTADHFAMAFQYKSGPGGVTASSDTGVGRVSTSTGLVISLFEEDTDLAGNANNVFWGQFSPHVAASDTDIVWSAALTGTDTTTATNAGVFKVVVAGNEVQVARKGDTAPGATKFSTFIGQTISSAGSVMHRATLTGTATTTNEGLYHQGYIPFGGLVGQKGTAVDNANLPGIKYSRFLKFWAIEVDAGVEEVIFMAQLSGTGVTTANDVALIHSDMAGHVSILLREGDSVEGNDAPKVSVIQQVDVSAKNGRYVVLASLTGNTAKNQALFSGLCADGAAIFDQPGHRLPGMVLRKGVNYQSAAGVTTTIKSITLPNTTDVSGAGGKGASQVISKDGRAVLTIDFGNGAREVMTGDL